VCDKLSNELLLGADIIDKLNRVWLNDQNVTVSYIDMTVVSDDTCVSTKIMNNDVSYVKSPITNGDDDDVETVIDLDNVNKDDDNDKSRNVADAEQIALEQQNDKSLALCFSLAERNKAGYYIIDNILYRKENILGHEVEQLCLPRSRRSQAIRLAHETFDGHLAAKKTKARLKMLFTWPTIATAVETACEKCHVCQKRRRITVYDRVPIAPVPSNEVVFHTFVMDCLGQSFLTRKLNLIIVWCCVIEYRDFQ